MDHQSNEVVSSSRNSSDLEEENDSLYSEAGDYHDAEDRPSSPEDDNRPAALLPDRVESCRYCKNVIQDCVCYEPYYPDARDEEIHDNRLYVKVCVGDHVFTGLIDPGNLASYMSRYMAGICQFAGWQRNYYDNDTSCVMGEAIVDGTRIYHRYWVLEHLDFSVTLGRDILTRLELQMFLNNRRLEPYYSEAPAEPDEMSMEEEEEEEEGVFSEVEQDEEEERPGDEIEEAPVEPPREQPVVEAGLTERVINVAGLPRNIGITIRLTGLKPVKRCRLTLTKRRRV